MKNKNFNLRGLSQEIISSLKKESKRLQISVNSLIIRLLEDGLALSKAPIHYYHDLDHLAGTWSEADEESFKNATKHFEKIDQELWEE